MAKNRVRVGPMGYRYPAVSAGFLGHLTSGATLNSSFQAEAIRSELWHQSLTVFPQRIPMCGFFEELRAVEGPAYGQKFREVSQSLLFAFEALLASHKRSTQRAVELHGLGALLLRRGEAAELRRYWSRRESDEEIPALQLVLAEGRLIEALSNDASIPASSFLELAQAAMAGRFASQKLQLRMIVRAVVVTHRHRTGGQNRNVAAQCLPYALRLLSELAERDDFSAKIDCSFAARGLAMIPTQDKSFRQSMLKRAQEWAETANPTNPLEELVAKENLLVLLQTLSKWHEHQRRKEQARDCLERMIAFDPTDSTGYSELGFHWLNHGDTACAQDAFLQARKLGPPGLALNLFYQGECLMELGQLVEAAACYEESACIDPHALSSRLALFELLRGQGDSSRARNVATEMAETKELASQLSPEERLELARFLHQSPLP